MPRALTVSLLLAVALLSGACTPLPPPIWQFGPGGASPGVLHSSVVYPHTPDDVETDHVPYDPNRVQLTGWHARENESMNLTAVLFWLPGPNDVSVLGDRDSGYERAYRELLDDNRLDGLLNTVVDTQGWTINLWVARVSRLKTLVGGNGFRIVKPPDPATSPLLAQAPATTDR